MKHLFILLALCTAPAIAQDSPHGDITLACETCHSTDSWSMRTDATFSHSSTKFALAGRHTKVHCSSCHQNLKFTGTGTECSSCHTDVHRSELGTDCLRCHSNESWIIPDMRQRHQQTRFPLVGRHLRATCESCHDRASSQRFSGTPLECVVCHEMDYRSTQNPNHVTAGISVECGLCHKVSSESWTGSFDHSLTDFPLTGAHRAVVCSDCHRNNQFTKLATDCFSCHTDDFNGALNPSHGTFPHDCTQCHRLEAWRPAAFNHSATRFPLVGAHTRTQCQVCHTAGNYQLTYTDCYQCHQDDFARPTNPNHLSAGYGHNCLQCHSQTSWSGATFDHSTTRFALVGAHVNKPCATCHIGGNYQLTYTDCYQCHQDDFARATNPNHSTGGYSHTCTQCHSQISWDGASFNHSTTRFPLTGAHISTACVSCHTGGNYQLSYTDCYPCHQDDFARPANPNHVIAIFSHDCTPCHTTSVWSPSTFNHDQQYFRIYSGTHQEKWTLCSECHASAGNYTQFTCIACHQHNRISVDQDHQGVRNYIYSSTSCYSCHRNS